MIVKNIVIKYDNFVKSFRIDIKDSEINALNTECIVSDILDSIIENSDKKVMKKLNLILGSDKNEKDYNYIRLFSSLWNVCINVFETIIKTWYI